MKTDELSAWLLHQRPTKDKTTQVLFLTRERGMVSAFCAGARGSKKRAILQPFTPLWLTLNERHYGMYVKQVEIASSTHFLVGESLLSGLYLNELLYRALKPDLCDDGLFEAYEATLLALRYANNRIKLEAALRQFEKRLIEVSGYQISYRHEAHTHQAITSDAYYAFLPGDGFVQQEEGILGAHILAISNGVWDDVSVLKVAKFIMRRAIDHLLDGAVIETRSLYQE